MEIVAIIASGICGFLFCVTTNLEHVAGRREIENFKNVKTIKVSFCKNKY
jgi:hypothetical protein